MAKENICILENDPVYSHLLSAHLHLYKDFETKLFTDEKSLIANLSLNPICIFLSFSKAGIVQLIQRIREYNPDIQIVLLCKPQEKEYFREFLKLGVREYLIKDKDIKASAEIVMSRLDYISRILREHADLKDGVFTEHTSQYQPVIGHHQEKPLQFFIRKAAATKLPALLLSVLGCQPELLARQIHEASSRLSSPFIGIDLSKLPKDQVNKAFFGISSQKAPGSRGAILAGDGGSVFVDHLELMSLKMQEKLMSFFSVNAYRTKGKAEISSNVRLIFSSYKNPQDLVNEGKMLSSLFEYVSTTSYRIIPLKDRLPEIPAIAEEYLQAYCDKNHLKHKTLSPKARAILLTHTYPEDLSELKLILQRAVALSPTDVIAGDAIQFLESCFHLDVPKGNKTPLEVKAQIVAHYLKIHNNKVSEVLKEIKIGKSTIYRMREKGLINF